MLYTEQEKEPAVSLEYLAQPISCVNSADGTGNLYRRYIKWNRQVLRWVLNWNWFLSRLIMPWWRFIIIWRVIIIVLRLKRTCYKFFFKSCWTIYGWTIWSVFLKENSKFSQKKNYTNDHCKTLMFQTKSDCLYPVPTVAPRAPVAYRSSKIQLSLFKLNRSKCENNASFISW